MKASNRIPREFIELLLNKIDLVDLIHNRIPLTKKSSNNFFACCPFHTEKSASFSVSQNKQFYHCFGCGAHGNAIDFVINYDRMSFPEAIENLSRLAGMEVPVQHYEKDQVQDDLYQLMREACLFYQTKLRHSERAVHYLKSRGISGQIAQQFALGYAPSSWDQLLEHLSANGIHQKMIHKAGLIVQKKEGGFYDRFRDRIIFPIHDIRGRIVGFGGRIIDHGEPKYLNSPETPLFQKGHELYGLHQSLKINHTLKKVLIVEGYMDVIALFQAGITYAVGTLGTATTQHHLNRLFRYTHEIIFCFDGDAAGRTAAWRALLVVFPLMRDTLQIRFLFLPDGEDPDSLIRKEGKEIFEGRIAKALSLSAFFLQTLSEQSDMSTMEGRAQMANSGIKLIDQLPHGIFRSLLLEALAKKAGVNVGELKRQAKTSLPTLQTTRDQTVTIIPPLKLAIGLLLEQPTLSQDIIAILPTIDLPGFSLLLQLIDLIKKNPTMTTAHLIEYWRGKENEAIIGQCLQSSSILSDLAKKSEFLGAIRQLTLLGYDQEINRLLAKASHTNLSEAEKIELAEWISKKKALK